jgi:GTPase SAR1 family protein
MKIKNFSFYFSNKMISSESTLKYLIIGDPGVGKSSLLTRLTVNI